MFRIGQKVVRIRDGARYDVDPYRPVVGAVYTIRGFVLDRGDGDLGLYLVEVVNPPRTILGSGGLVYRECAWAAQCFRPVVQRKTDISALEKLLDVISQKQSEPV